MGLSGILKSKNVEHERHGKHNILLFVLLSKSGCTILQRKTLKVARQNYHQYYHNELASSSN